MEEAQPYLATDVFHVITTEELGFRSSIDSEDGSSLEYSNVFNRMTSDRVEDGYADPQMNAGVEGTEQFQRINEGHRRHSNVLMF